MKFNFIRSELLEHIKNTIKPMYKTFDNAHNLSHFNFVTNNCINYAQELISKGEIVDLEIAYVVGAYHDTGISLGRDGHALSSGEIVRQDKTLRKFYNSNTIELIAQAVEDHSSHLSHSPRSIYGKIVADADRNNSVYLVFSRPIKYGLKHDKNLNKTEHIIRVYDFVTQKFGKDGYVKYHLDISSTRQAQNDVWELLANKEKCYAYISGLLDEITKGKLK